MAAQQFTRRGFVSSALAAGLAARPDSASRSPILPEAVLEIGTDQIERIVYAYLPTVSPHIGAAVGIASPFFGARITCFGSLLDQNGLPMVFTTDTPFEIASVTKTVTASVYERLIQTGQINGNTALDGLIDPAVSSTIRSIPLYDLANYTSGLPADNVDCYMNCTYPTPLGSSYTLAEMISFLSSPTFTITPPGTTYSYSNLGFSLLAIALQAAVGAGDFQTLANTEILQNLGMAKTQLWSPSTAALLPQGFQDSANAAPNGYPLFPAYFGAAGLLSTPNDMMTWLQFNMGIIQSDTLSGILSALHTPAAEGVSGLPAHKVPGLGWNVTTWFRSDEKLTLIEKNGDLEGFTTQVALLPPAPGSPSPAGVFVLVNSGQDNINQGSAASRIARDLLFAMKRR